MEEHKIQARIYFADTDAGGVVYHSKYLDFAERGRGEFLRDIGYNHGKSFFDTNSGFVARHCEIDYKAPARLDDLIDIYTKVGEVKNSSLVMEQRICLGEQELAIIKIVLVYINEKFKPARVPKDLLDRI